MYRRSLKCSYQIKAGLERICTGLPLSRANFITMLCNELASLKLTKKLVSISSDVCGVYLICNNLEVRIYNKCSSLSNTVSLDKKFEISCFAIEVY